MPGAKALWLRLLGALVVVSVGCDGPGGGRGGVPADALGRPDVGASDIVADGGAEPMTYAATRGAGGERCGSDGQDWVECQPRDGCRDSEANLCVVVTGDYRAWLDGGGQRCGLNDLGTQHTYCVPRDRCVDADAAIGICQHQSGDLYPAYKKADGAACGEDGWFFVYCEPGDECVNEDDNVCG